jgi:toxin-antitoxin system, toxin component, Txe/YoeB family
MELVWQTHAWEDYLYWQQTDKKTLLRINELIKDAMRSPFKGIGKPEPLKGNYAGCWSRRITDEHRLVYKVRDNRLHILQCRFHYDH